MKQQNKQPSPPSRSPPHHYHHQQYQRAPARDAYHSRDAYHARDAYLAPSPPHHRAGRSHDVVEDQIQSLRRQQREEQSYPPQLSPPPQQYYRAPARAHDAIEDQIQSLRQQQREEQSYHPAPHRWQQHRHFDPYDATPQQAVHRSSYRPPQQEPVYEHRTERVARMSYSPDQGRQVEYTVSHSNQVTQQPRQQFARLPRSGSEQQRLQYEENPPRSAPHYRRR